MKIKLYFWAAAALLIMILIFWFSSQTAEESGELSGAVTEGTFGNFNISESIMETAEVLVRKTAHLFIFAVLGFCAANAVRQMTDNPRYIFLSSLILGSFYGAVDEWHQYFVPGRACMWQDWLIDTLGVLLGIGVSFMIAGFIKKFKNKRVRIGNA